MKPIVKGLWIVVVMLLALAAPALASDQDAIRAVMMKTWDRPDSRLVVDPVAISGDHAIAGWSQGDMGGRALLRKKGAAWDVVLCAGDDLKKTDVLSKVGLPDAIARALSADLARAEAKLAPERLALFSKFEGLMMVNGDGGHHSPGPGSGHPQGHKP